MTDEEIQQLREIMALKGDVRMRTMCALGGKTPDPVRYKSDSLHGWNKERFDKTAADHQAVAKELNANISTDDFDPKHPSVYSIFTPKTPCTTQTTTL